MTTDVSADSVPIPAEVSDLTAGWFSQALDCDVTVDDATAREQYRLFSVYSWIAATSTAAMGSKWQPIEIARPAMIRATEAVEDLDAVGLLEERLGLS